jgi:hypothetical protein
MQATKLRTFAKTTPYSTFHLMSQQPNLKLLPREDRIILAIQAMKSNVLIS